MKWVFKSKEEYGISIHLKSINVVKGYMKVSGVKYTYPFSPVATGTSAQILIGINLFHKEEGWVSKICDAEEEFLHPYMSVAMLIKWP